MLFRFPNARFTYLTILLLFLSGCHFKIPGVGQQPLALTSVAQEIQRRGYLTIESYVTAPNGWEIPTLRMRSKRFSSFRADRLMQSTLANPAMLPLAGWSPETDYQQSNSVCRQPSDEQGAIFAKAEKEKYLIGRIEVIGNAKTRDSVLRQRILLHEGKVFTRRVLARSLTNASKLKMIHPVNLSDVVGELNEKEKTINVRFCFTEKTPYPAK